MVQKLNSSTIIYLAEDDEDDSILFLDALREINAEIGVKVFEDGQQLLDSVLKTKEENPDVIFLDINMPCRNGFECLKELRSADLNSVKIIMFSTSSSVLHIELSYMLGADYYAVKPGSFQELKELLNTIMEIDWTTASRNKKEFLLVSRKIKTI